MLSVEPRGLHGGDEELRAVGVGAGVGHGEKACTLYTTMHNIYCNYRSSSIYEIYMIGKFKSNIRR